MDLREYEQHKFAIADLLRQMEMAALDKQRWRNQATALFTRLAEDRFNLVLVGRFSRGETSLMNAILGMDRLPTGIIPLTSVTTSVAYGSVERVRLRFTKSFMDEDVPLASLPQYVTQQGNPGNAKGIKEAEVQLPADILRRGFYFVDTCWDAAPEYVAILKANSGMDPASQFAIVNYLKRATEAVAAAQ